MRGDRRRFDSCWVGRSRSTPPAPPTKGGEKREADAAWAVPLQVMGRSLRVVARSPDRATAPTEGLKSVAGPLRRLEASWLAGRPAVGAVSETGCGQERLAVGEDKRLFASCCMGRSRSTPPAPPSKGGEKRAPDLETWSPSVATNSRNICASALLLNSLPGQSAVFMNLSSRDWSGYARGRPRF